MLVVHIGLGKTATTALQQFVFPGLTALRPDISFNDPVLYRSCRKHHLFGLGREELQRTQARLWEGHQLISIETLVDWNPGRWEEAAAANLELFGPDAAIVITVREPVAYLTSIYQQMIQVGNIKPPQDFFIDESAYRSVARQLPSWRLDYFNVDAFDLSHLHELYQARFSRVYMVPMDDIRHFDFLCEPFALSADQLAMLQQTLDDSAPANRSYSAASMRLTFARERLYRLFGARSIGSNDRDLLELYRSLDRAPADSPSEHLQPAGALRRLTAGATWRNLLQRGLDRIWPYSRYRLPAGIDLNADRVAGNRRYLEQLRAQYAARGTKRT